jgi:NAD(P)-dependent dehydrogenase (short-subunit alcohol dehydrogenase family)
MELGLRDRVVLITGGSAGIGQATARAFGAEGARVAITYHRHPEGADKTAAEVTAAGGTCMTAAMDLGAPESIAAAVSAVSAAWDGIDVLVCNAVEWGVPAWGAKLFEEIPVPEWQRMLRTSLEGVFHLVQAALPAMRPRPWGRIILLSSGSAEFGLPGEAAYGAAKAGLHGLNRSLARELGPAGIFVNVVMPGLTTTERNLEYIPQGVRDALAGQSASSRLSCPDDVASAVVFLGSAANGNITGEIVRVTGGM